MMIISRRIKGRKDKKFYRKSSHFIPENPGPAIKKLPCKFTFNLLDFNIIKKLPRVGKLFRAKAFNSND